MAKLVPVKVSTVQHVPSPSSPTSPAVPPSGCTAFVLQFLRATARDCRLLLCPYRFHALAVAACMSGIEATLQQFHGATVLTALPYRPAQTQGREIVPLPVCHRQATGNT